MIMFLERLKFVLRTLNAARLCGLAAVYVIANGGLLAQRPHVAAPHKPIPATLQPMRSLPPADARIMVGGPWMTSANYHSVLIIKNYVKTASITVHPVLYLANGRAYPLQDVTMEPSGVASIDINRALTTLGVAPWTALSGYLELEYQWPWDALCATIQNSDPLHSEVFVFDFHSKTVNGTSVPAMNSSQQSAPANKAVEGLWWKQEKSVSSFVALSNVSAHQVTASVEVNDRVGNLITNRGFTLAPHTTEIVQLSEILSAETIDGGLHIIYQGEITDLLIAGGLEDPSTGYSAEIPFVPSEELSSAPFPRQYAAVGLMTGDADPMLKFPTGTVFSPYASLRNLSAQNIVITPTIWWMQGATPQSARLQEFTLRPSQSTTLDMTALLTRAGLQHFRGSVNLILETVAPLHSLLIASGSVDKKNTYVFSVPMSSVSESMGKGLSYWSTGNGDDTMVTIWNPADDPQDFIFTLFFSGGKYDLPIHLDGRVSRSFNISDIIQNEIPDLEGRTIPVTVREGSAELVGSQGVTQHILAAVGAGTYNVLKATCQLYCITC